MWEKSIGQLMLQSSMIINSELSSYSDLLLWIKEISDNTRVKVDIVNLEDCSGWEYDSQQFAIRNVNNGFFKIIGIKSSFNDSVVEQPIILQDEIGYLGIIVKEINGVLFFLMQAKIEPGNINCVQISPTIQATRSNFTRIHGGKTPKYLDYFLNVSKENVIVDQIQSEQGSRFYKKRNRNIIIEVQEDLEVFPNHRWMTLGQIHELLKIPNLVNMDSRTVLSCIPWSFFEYGSIIRKRKPGTIIGDSFMREPDYKQISDIFSFFNDIKMKAVITNERKSLECLDGWAFTNLGLTSNGMYPFDVIFCNIEIEGREVNHWCQPLFRATENAIFILACHFRDGQIEFLVHANHEIGTFDIIELAPSAQIETINCRKSFIDSYLFEKTKDGSHTIYDNFLSEEGGRFYHEENRNVILLLDTDDLISVPEGYFWCSFSTLNYLCQINNVLNIQLRNLLSLLEVH